MHDLVTETGKSIDNQAPDRWLWLGHRVIMGDGCTVTMVRLMDGQLSLWEAADVCLESAPADRTVDILGGSIRLAGG
ncbi:MAG: hypothetical protein KY475_17000 [Planctomycetes bacterium]|nr:hypothetical protein [Planctomycetota bacterium]